MRDKVEWVDESWSCCTWCQSVYCMSVFVSVTYLCGESRVWGRVSRHGKVWNVLACSWSLSLIRWDRENRGYRAPGVHSGYPLTQHLSDLCLCVFKPVCVFLCCCCFPADCLATSLVWPSFLYQATKPCLPYHGLGSVIYHNLCVSISTCIMAWQLSVSRSQSINSVYSSATTTHQREVMYSVRLRGDRLVH